MGDGPEIAQVVVVEVCHQFSFIKTNDCSQSLYYQYNRLGVNEGVASHRRRL
jgi:hypothetical protein